MFELEVTDVDAAGALMDAAAYRNLVETSS